MILNNPKNIEVLNYLKQGHPEFICEIKQCQFHDKEVDMKISTHPESANFLWNTLANKIDVNCAYVLFDTAVLINPLTGIIFAIAEGTYPPLLRLSKDLRNEVIKQGGSIRLSNLDGVYADAHELGADWLYCYTFIPNLEDYCLKAYVYSL
jgi:hypothetical protein